jgi:hypothetical protein
MTDEWSEFIAAHPEFAGERPDEPDPGARVYPVFQEWQARRELENLTEQMRALMEADSMAGQFLPRLPGESALEFKLRSGKETRQK